jgi:hypothetical protein
MSSLGLELLGILHTCTLNICIYVYPDHAIDVLLFGYPNHATNMLMYVIVYFSWQSWEFMCSYTLSTCICIPRSCHKFVVVCTCLFQLAFMGIIIFLYTKYLLLYLQVIFIDLWNMFFARGCIYK